MPEKITHGRIIADKYYRQFLQYPLPDDFKNLADLIDEELDKSCESCLITCREENEKWINIKDELPPYDEYVLLKRYNHWGDNAKICIVYGKRTCTNSSGDHYKIFREEEAFGSIIAWMTLPK